MAVRNDLAPLPVVKTWAKRLVKAWPAVDPFKTKPTLSVCQEAIARVLGHPDWHGLLSSYEQVPRENEKLSENEAFNLNADHSSTMEFDYLVKMLRGAIEQGYDALHIELDDSMATIKGRKGSKLTGFMQMSPMHCGTLLSIFYNVLSEGKDVCFNPAQTQTAILRVSLNNKPYFLYYKSIPRFPNGCNAVIEILHVGASQDNKDAAMSAGVQRLAPAQDGLFIIASSCENTRMASLSALGLALAAKKHVLALSGGLLPQLENMHNIALYPLFAGAGPSLLPAVKASQTMPHDAVLVNYEPTQQGDWEALEAIRQDGGPCFVSMKAPSLVDVLIKLDRMGRLNDLLKYGLLRGVALANPSLDKAKDPISRVVMLTAETQERLMMASPHQWGAILEEG